MFIWLSANPFVLLCLYCCRFFPPLNSQQQKLSHLQTVFIIGYATHPKTENKKSHRTAKRQNAMAFPSMVFFGQIDFSGAEKQGNAPQTCKANQGKNDAAHNRTLTAKKPAYYIKGKKADTAPV